MRRNYNHTVYKGFHDTTKFIRENHSENPLEKIENTGLTGKIISDVGNAIIEKPIQKASYKLTGLNYNKKKDKPYKGSAIYTANYLIIKKVAKVVLSFVLGLGIFGVIFKFLNSDIITQVKMSGGLVVLIFLTYIVNKIKSFLK